MYAAYLFIFIATSSGSSMTSQTIKYASMKECKDAEKDIRGKLNDITNITFMTSCTDTAKR